jgi:hypothetical protein
MRKTIHFWVFLMVLYSCGASSETTIEIIGTPDLEIIAEFGVEPPKEIQYQFYQKYGFTDVVEQLIIVGRINKVTKTVASTFGITNLEWIDSAKYREGQPIDVATAFDSQGDVLIEGKVFDKLEVRKLFFKIDDTSVFRTDSTETVMLIDRKNDLFFIESIKQE